MKTLQSNKRAFDVDGILVDFCSQVFEKVAKEIGYDIEPNGIAYNMEDYYGISSDVVHEIWCNHDLLAKYILLAKPSFLINDVKDTDYILTARGTHGIFKTDTLVRHATIDWLKKHGINSEVFFLNPNDKVTFCKQSKINVLYDDKPETIVEALNEGIKVCSIKWEYNKHLWDDNRITWLEYS